MMQGWGFSSVVERLPSKRKALGLVPSSEKTKTKTKTKTPKQTNKKKPKQNNYDAQTEWYVDYKQDRPLPSHSLPPLHKFVHTLAFDTDIFLIQTISSHPFYHLFLHIDNWIGKEWDLASRKYSQIHRQPYWCLFLNLSLIFHDVSQWGNRPNSSKRTVTQF